MIQSSYQKYLHRSSFFVLPLESIVSVMLAFLISSNSVFEKTKPKSGLNVSGVQLSIVPIDNFSLGVSDIFFAIQGTNGAIIQTQNTNTKVIVFENIFVEFLIYEKANSNKAIIINA